MIEESHNKPEPKTWPNGPEYFKKPITKTWDLEDTPGQLMEQMGTIVRYPQETNEKYNSQ